MPSSKIPESDYYNRGGVCSETIYDIYIYKYINNVSFHTTFDCLRQLWTERCLLTAILLFILSTLFELTFQMYTATLLGGILKNR